MVVALIDTNILIDYYCRREQFYDAAEAVMDLCTADDVDGYVAIHSIPNIWYILRKSSEDTRRKILLNVCAALCVVGVEHEEVLRAINTTGFKDLEDCLQDQCAMKIKADCIVTRNTKDYEAAETKAVTPQEFCEMVAKERQKGI